MDPLRQRWTVSFGQDAIGYCLAELLGNISPAADTQADQVRIDAAGVLQNFFGRVARVNDELSATAGTYFLSRAFFSGSVDEKYYAQKRGAQ